MNPKKDFHDLLRSCKLSTKKIAEITGLGISTINNHKSDAQKRWTSEENSKLGIMFLNEYLEKPTNMIEIVSNFNGEVISVKKGSARKIVEELDEDWVRMTETIQINEQQITTLQNQNDFLREECNRIKITIETLRKKF